MVVLTYTTTEENTMAKLSKAKSKELSVLLSCIKSASRTQALARAAYQSNPDSIVREQEWMDACDASRAYEEQIKALVSAQEWS